MITDKPRPDMQFATLKQQRHAGQMGMWVFLATELLLFGGLFAAFTVARLQHTGVFAEAAHHLDLTLGTLNTSILLTSGLTMALAEQAVGKGRRHLAMALVMATIVLGCVFLGIKGYEWSMEHKHHLMPVLGMTFQYPGPHGQQAEMFFNFYFTMTGLHAAHMLLGLFLLLWLTWRIWRWPGADRVDRQAGTVGLYWAFVDVVWIFVFTSLYLLRI